MFGWRLGKPRQTLKGLGREPFRKEDYPGFREGFIGQDDRSCAIMTGAVFERYLGYRIHLEFKPLPEKEEEAMFHDANGVLGSFSNRIAIARGLGLISSQEKTDIDVIRQIRNVFSHVSREITFEEDIVASACRQLNTGGPFDPRIVSPRQQFTKSASAILDQLLDGTINTTTKRLQKIKADIDERFGLFAKAVQETSNFDELKLLISKYAIEDLP